MSERPTDLNWSFLKDFLVVQACGSLSGAARQLGVSQPTLTRRMAALERSLGSELFRRSPRGLELSEAGEALVGPIREMEQQAEALELAVSGRDRALAGTVRITATEGLAVEWLTPELARFRERHPLVDVEVVVRNTAVNVLRREADIAVRLGRPQQSGLVARRVGELVLGLFASRSYLDAHGRPRVHADLAGHRGISFDAEHVHTGAGSWLERGLGSARIVYRANSLSAQLAAIRAGFGIGGQSCFIARRHADLERVLPDTEVRLEVWLVTHPGLRRSARVRAAFDFLAEQLQAARPLLADTREAAG